MGLIITQNSTLGRELWKWDHTVNEVHPDDGDKPRHEQLRGMRPASPQMYPRMLYKAHKRESGKVMCRDVEPNPVFFRDQNEFERAVLAVTSFNRSCEKIVNSEDEHRKEKTNGWKDTPDEALAYYESLEQDMAAAAAEAAFGAQRMSKKAKRELAAADAATHRHVVDVKGGSKRGRPRKNAAVSADPESRSGQTVEES